MGHKDSLEAKRQEILQQMSAITRMRRGTVNEQYFEVRENDGSTHRRGPYFLYSRTEKGKSFSQRVTLEEVDRYREETDNCRRFKELSSRCVMVCEALAEADEGSREKKMVEAETERIGEIARFTALAEKAYARNGVVDMEALEQGMRAAALKDGAIALAVLLRNIVDHEPGPVTCPHCAAPMESHGRRSKEIITLLGETTVDRAYYGCTRCDGHLFPKDALLDIERTSFSPGVRRLMARSGARDSFAKAEEDLWEYSGIRLGAKDVERVAEAIGADIERREQRVRAEAMAGEVATSGKPIPVLYVAYDGTGVPVTKRETAGRKGKQTDGSAKTREAKLGCIFTQTGTDAKGFPLRVEGSTTYTGAIETAEAFGERLFAEALTRGLSHAALVVVLGDGAHWIWNLAALHFPHAVHIVDLYHAREHLYALLRLIFSPGTFYEARCKEWCDWLEKGKVEQIILAASQLLPKEEHALKSAATEIEYFNTNLHRMRYGDFRARGLFVGSGVVEAGCKNIIAARMKKSGAKWSVRGANNIITLRCTLASSRFEDYWAQRASA